MADIHSAAQWLGRLLVEEAKYLYQVEDKVKELRDELDWMHCFLRVADAFQYDNAMARRWIAQIREFTYEAEDTIEKFLVRVVTNSRGRADILGMVNKVSSFLLKAGLLHQIGSEIDILKHKISNLTSKLHTYGINLKVGESSSSWLSRDKITFTHSKEEKIFGRDVFMKKLVKDLVNGTQKRVYSICGVGGVGKTFVAKKIFHHSKIREHFEAFAWAYVSQPCQVLAILQDLLSSLTSKSKEQISQITNPELKIELKKVMRKYKCLIVLDGIWDKEVWKSLEESFAIASYDNGSKLLITNQLEEVAKHVHSDVEICQLQRLNGHDSKWLLEEKIKDVPGDIYDHKDHNQKAEARRKGLKLKENMLEHCEGLPLVISVLGGVLATKKTLKEWEEMNKYISSYTIDDHHVPKWKRIIEYSYYDLPYQLKPGFLYLGYFPTNLEIPIRKIIRLWEAEGLVSSTDDELSVNTLENVAEHCLGELVERSLVQVGSRGLTGKVKTCLVHDHMRELCMAKASQGNWLSIVRFGDEETEPSGKSSEYPKYSKSAKKKYRRLAIYYSRTSGKLPKDYHHARYIRSLLFFNTLTSDEVLIPLKGLILKQAFGNYKLLRVLDIGNIEVQRLPKEVGFLIHLRYLSLRGSWVSKLPSTIKNLRCLQTLDLRVLSFVHLRIPDVLCMMERLIHLYLPLKEFIILHNVVKLRLEGLKNLETLSNFSKQCRAEDVGKLYNLRRFSSYGFLSDVESIMPLLGSRSGSSDSKLEHVEHVSLGVKGKILKKNPEIFACCNKVRKLWVRGEISESLSSGMLPENLIKVTFDNSKFQSDPMQVLENLPHLKKLSLKHASYMGKAMKCSEGKFQELEHLILKDLESLEDWIVEEKAMPKLSHLKINGCQKLKEIPEGFRSITSLRELEISFMPFSFFIGLGKSPKDMKNWVHYPKVQHVPYIKIFHVLDLEDVKTH